MQVWYSSLQVLVCGMDLVIQKREDEKEPPMPEFDPLTKLQLTPSQRALGKYLFTVLALFVLQVTLGAGCSTLHS